ncbi:hypothetical protein ACFL5C_00370 [Candidatus Omnitrophota bacterium]
MKKLLVLVMAVCLATSFMLAGCGPQKAATSREAINESKTMATVQEKTTYLVSQAQSFYNSKEFQGAVDIAQYILQYVDKDSPAAKKLLEEAKNAIAAQLKQKAEEAKKSFGF